MQSHQNFTYKDTRGNKIAEALDLCDFLDAHPLQNYQAIQKEYGLSIAEIQGRRASQEDRGVLGVFSSYSQIISAAEYKSILADTAAILQNTIATTGFGRNQGSTMCAVLIDHQDIYTANLGDSTAYLCVLDANGKITRFDRMNTLLHNPSMPGEKERIQLAQGQIYEGKLVKIHYGMFGYTDMLALSRGLGDCDFESSGLTHNPDIYFNIADIPEGGKAFVIVACDGLTENNNLTYEDIKIIIETNHDLPLDELAKKLAYGAYYNGSGDNISVAIANITKQDTQQRYVAIFDGHGGADVSELGSYLFDKILTLKIQQLVLKKILVSTAHDSALNNKLLILLDSMNAIHAQLSRLGENVAAHLDANYFLKTIYQEYTSCMDYIIKIIIDEKNSATLSRINPQLDALISVTDLIAHTGELLDCIPKPSKCLGKELKNRIIEALNEARTGNTQNVTHIHDEFIPRLLEIQDLLKVNNIILQVEKQYLQGCRLIETNSSKLKDIEHITDQIKYYLDDYSYSSAASLISNAVITLQTLHDQIKETPVLGKVSTFFRTEDRLKKDIRMGIENLKPLFNKYKPHDVIEPKRLTA